ncbi:MAG: hypothetical protein ABL995_12175 [Bryobacteraceae bacterium]
MNPLWRSFEILTEKERRAMILGHVETTRRWAATGAANAIGGTGGLLGEGAER